MGVSRHRCRLPKLAIRACSNPSDQRRLGGSRLHDELRLYDVILLPLVVLPTLHISDMGLIRIPGAGFKEVVPLRVVRL